MKTVLVCDDDQGILDIIKIILERAGFNVHTLVNPRNIFDLVDEINPNVILLDLWMPNLSGEEITKVLKNTDKTKDIPIVIISASNQTKEIAKEIGADDYISKPFDIREIESVVMEYTV